MSSCGVGFSGGQVSGEFGLNGFDAGQAGDEFRRQRPGQFIVGDADGLVDVAQGIFGQDAVLGLAEDEAEGGRVVLAPELVVHHGAVKVHLAGILGFEITLFQIHDNEATQVQVVEEQVEVELTVTDVEPVLAAYEGEATPEFQEELLQVGEQACLQLALMKGLLQGQEVEEVGIFEQALGQAGVTNR